MTGVQTCALPISIDADLGEVPAAQLVVDKTLSTLGRIDALLNIASCQTELKDRGAARKTLETLVAQYPDSSAAQTAKERLASMK